MFLFIFGWGERLKQLAGGTVQTCGRCHNTTTWQRLRRQQQITLFFIPVARWGRREIEACPICGQTAPLPRQERPTGQHRHATA